MRLLQNLRALKPNKSKFIAGLVLITGMSMTGGLTVQVASADASNDIINGGFSTPQDFINKVKRSSELQHIYAYPAYGLQPSQYDQFVHTAVQGTAYKNGDIKVGGQVVATNMKSIGRNPAYQGSDYFTQHIPGAGTYYGNINAKAFASDSVPVTVMFDGHGVPVFAVINNCGNPGSFVPKKPTYACNNLHMQKVDEQDYNFTTSASAGNGAKVAYVVYDFGDGQQSGHVSPTQVVHHHYAMPSATKTYTVKVSVHVTLPGGNSDDTVPAGDCVKQLTIKVTPPQPVYLCSGLTGFLTNDKSKLVYQFTATPVAKNGATPDHANFTFGDGQKANNVRLNNKNVFLVTHKYTQHGRYAVAAQLYFKVNGQLVAAKNKCQATAVPTGVVQECKPGVPMGSPECTPCQYNQSLPSNSPQCQPPQGELPNTGTGNIIAIFSAAVVGGFLLYRHVLYRRHKAAFMAAEAGTSPLPLADAMNDTDPLRDTPLAPKAKRRSFRRKRQF